MQMHVYGHFLGISKPAANQLFPIYGLIFKGNNDLKMSFYGHLLSSKTIFGETAAPIFSTLQFKKI